MCVFVWCDWVRSFLLEEFVHRWWARAFSLFFPGNFSVGFIFLLFLLLFAPASSPFIPVSSQQSYSVIPNIWSELKNQTFIFLLNFKIKKYIFKPSLKKKLNSEEINFKKMENNRQLGIFICWQSNKCTVLNDFLGIYWLLNWRWNRDPRIISYLLFIHSRFGLICISQIKIIENGAKMNLQ